MFRILEIERIIVRFLCLCFETSSSLVQIYIGSFNTQFTDLLRGFFFFLLQVGLVPIEYELIKSIPFARTPSNSHFYTRLSSRIEKTAQ